MRSRENRVILAALLAAVALSVGLAVVDIHPGAVGVFAIYAVAILAPQLYLAATTDDVAPRTRIRVGVLVTALLALVLWNDTGGLERQLLGGLVLALVAGLLAYEIITSSQTGTTTRD